MRVGHWDAGFGISGDMALGSLLDAGAPAEAVSGALASLGVPGLRVEVGRAARCGVDCARIRIRWEGDGGAETANEAHAPAGRPDPEAAHGHPHDQGHPHADAGEHGHGHGPTRPYSEVRRLLADSGLAPAVRERAEAVFACLAEAEGRVHGAPAERVHLHEVGAEDALGDVVGTAAALEALGIGELTVSPLPAGGGTIRAAHGRLPVPAPAVAVLLRGFAVQPGPVEAELVTPTGAAIVAALGSPARSWPAMVVAGSGWGAGTREFEGHPNACRFVWGEAEGSPADWREERLVELETNLDDQTPEAVGHLYERLFRAGALDVATAPLWMKKQRPGVRLWALVRPADAEAAARCLFAESTAIGLRTREVRRWSLPRERVAVATPYGEVHLKVARMAGREVNAAPEFEDCRAAAEASGVPLKAVLAAALAAWAARG